MNGPYEAWCPQSQKWRYLRAVRDCLMADCSVLQQWTAGVIGCSLRRVREEKHLQHRPESGNKREKGSWGGTAELVRENW